MLSLLALSVNACLPSAAMGTTPTDGHGVTVIIYLGTPCRSVTQPTVEVPGLDLAMESDRAGWGELGKLPRGRHRIVVSSPGHATVEAVVTVTDRTSRMVLLVDLEGARMRVAAGTAYYRAGGDHRSSEAHGAVQATQRILEKGRR